MILLQVPTAYTHQPHHSPPRLQSCSNTIQKSTRRNDYKTGEGLEKESSMLSSELQDYIEKMREDQQSSDGSGGEESGEQLMSGLAQNIALFFNQIIYSINCLKNNSQYYRDLQSTPSKQKTPKTAKIDPLATDNVESYAESNDKRAEECANQQEIEEMKDLDEIYRTKEEKLSNLPKKPVSSFFMYYQDHSKDFTAQVGEVGGSRLAQIVADTWKKLPLEVKQPYYDRVAADKKRYADEITKYIQEHSNELEDIKRLQRLKKHRMKKLARKEGEEDEDELDSEPVSNKIKGISQRQIKAADRRNYSHRPKAPVSSFFIFYQEEARNIAHKYGQTVGSRLARLASNLWKGMSKDEKEKYEQSAKVERDRYHQEMIQYKIDYPNEIESRRKKISNSMKRALRDNNELQKDEEEEEGKEGEEEGKEEGEEGDADSSQSLPNLSEDNSSNSQSSQSSNSYVSSPEEQKKSEQSQQAKPLSRRREKEDPMPHKPKGPICSFFQFYHAHIHEFMKKEGENQKDAGSEFVRRASIKWKTLSEEEKQVYHEMARIDRHRYQKDMSHFKEAYPKEFEAFLQFGKNKQIKNKRKKLAKLEDLKDLEFDDIVE